MANMTAIIKRLNIPWIRCLLILLLASALLTNAHVILYNGRIYTVDTDHPEATALAFDEQGVITGVGSYQSLLEQFPDYETLDLQGQLVLPGFIDPHQHPVEFGINSQICYVSNTAPLAEIPLWLQDCPNSGAFGDQGWIVGAGVDLANLVAELEQQDAWYTPLQVLDDSFPDTPVVILDQLGHGALANSAAMNAVGYQAGTDLPEEGGHVLKDINGNRLGIVLENAQQKLRDAFFPPTKTNQETAYQSLLQAQTTLNRNGITTVSDAGGFWRQAQTESWARAEREGLLTVRASNALYIYPDEVLETQLPKLERRFSNDKTKLVRFNQAKIYVDGILSLGTGKVYDPYLYDPFAPYKTATIQEEWRGMEYFGNSSNLNRVAQSLVDKGFQLHVHVTGDDAANLAITAIEQLTTNSTGPHRLTHCYLVDAADRPRLARAGIVADFQMAPSSVTRAYQDDLAELVGTNLAATLLPIQQVYDEGAMVTLSSDWDADALSPLVKLQTVMKRGDFQKLETIIPMMTLNAAKLLHQDSTTGSITVGKYADLVVIDQDIFDLPYDQIATAKVTRTYLQGEVVFGDSIASSKRSGNKVSNAYASTRGHGRTNPKHDDPQWPGSKHLDAFGLTINILHDAVPHETSWELARRDGDTWTTVRLYLGSEEGQESSMVSTSLTNLVGGAWYRLTVSDEGSNGICCDRGKGWISVTGVVLATTMPGLVWGNNGEFGSSIEVYIEIDSSGYVDMISLDASTAETA
ncbi:substituted formamide deformylase [Seminavis robusta]|uniref:Substituted formamide deformylase n=1 Tax=Seminavis robusta TaxID=568900 RepID=A0A9N8HBA2_9STRA|nr:substituted formamide deformylase [Seminavis robusta]|eukprot:Sro269_g104070.1 substituted formamide deformylase (751) ;mRNA; r:56183-58435